MKSSTIIKADQLRLESFLEDRKEEVQEEIQEEKLKTEFIKLVRRRLLIATQVR